MPTWPRSKLPTEASWPDFPGPLRAVGQSGATQSRSTTQVGRTWQEVYGPLRRGDPEAQAFLAVVNNYWRNGTIFQIDHRAQRALLGAGGGSPTVNGGSQTGMSINTHGWSAGVSGILKAGDVLLLPGLTVVYDVTMDVDSDGSGNVAIPINPPIFVGGSPTDAGAVTINATPGAVSYRALIDTVQMPTAGVNEAYMGLTITFREVPV